VVKERTSKGLGERECLATGLKKKEKASRAGCSTWGYL